MHALDQAWENVRREFDTACSQMGRAARAQLTNELNQMLRRLRQYQTEGEWITTLLDGAARFVHQVAVFELRDGTFALRAQTNLKLPSELTFPATSGAAFMTAIEMKDPVMALRTAAEVTPELSGEAGTRAHLVPIVNGDRVVAVLFAADEDFIDVNALELIAGVAATVLERKSNTTVHSQIAAAPQAPPRSQLVVAPSSQRPLPPWADLSATDRELHLRAQRFSRVAVAEMQIANPEGCRAGRNQGDLYLYLKQEIDRARNTYRQQFMTVPSMVDYLHLELIRTAAEGDESRLGADYPGQLV